MEAAIVRFSERPALSPSGHLSRLEATLRLAGWDVRNIDLDLVNGRAVVDLHRDDGRWVLLSVDGLGRAHLERHHRSITNTNTRPYTSPIRDVFLGRQRCEGPRSALRTLCTYVALNPAPGKKELPPSSVRAAFAALMSAPVKSLEAHNGAE